MADHGDDKLKKAGYQKDEKGAWSNPEARQTPSLTPADLMENLKNAGFEKKDGTWSNPERPDNRQAADFVRMWGKDIVDDMNRHPEFKQVDTRLLQTLQAIHDKTIDIAGVVEPQRIVTELNHRTRQETGKPLSEAEIKHVYMVLGKPQPSEPVPVLAGGINPESIEGLRDSFKKWAHKYQSEGYSLKELLESNKNARGPHQPNEEKYIYALYGQRPPEK